MVAFLGAMAAATVAALVIWTRFRSPGRSAIEDAEARELLRSLLGPTLRAEGIDAAAWVPLSGNTRLLRTTRESLLERSRGNVVAGGDRLATLIQEADVPPIEAASLMDVICTSAVGGTPLAGHVEKALIWADAGLARKPDHRPLQATRAGLLVLNGRAGEGVTLLESFFRIASPEQRGWIAGLLALGLHRLGRAPDAEIWWSEADAAVAAGMETSHQGELAAAVSRWRALAAAPD